MITALTTATAGTTLALTDLTFAPQTANLSVTNTWYIRFCDGSTTFVTSPSADEAFLLAVTSPSADEAFLLAVTAERAKAAQGLFSRRVLTVEVAQ